MNEKNEIQESRTDLLNQYICKTKVLQAIALDRKIKIENILEAKGFSEKREKLGKLLSEDEQVAREEIRANELAGRLYHLMMSEEAPDYIYRKINKNQFIFLIDGMKGVDPIQARITVVPSEKERLMLAAEAIKIEHEWERKKFEAIEDFFKDGEELWRKIKYQRLEILQLDSFLTSKTRYFIERIRKFFLGYSYC